MKERWLHAAVVIIAVAASVFAGYRIAKAGELTPEQAWHVYVVAYGQMHGPRVWLDKVSMPVIHLASQDELCALLNDHPGCGAQGVYLNGHNIVEIDKTLDFSTVYATTVLLHEFIHHFQFLKHGMPKDCWDMAMRERQAYLIQAFMLERGGEYTLAYGVVKSGLIHVRCPVEVEGDP